MEKELEEFKQKLQRAFYAVLWAFRKRTAMTRRHKRRMIKRLKNAARKVCEEEMEIKFTEDYDYLALQMTLPGWKELEK